MRQLDDVAQDALLEATERYEQILRDLDEDSEEFKEAEGEIIQLMIDHQINELWLEDGTNLLLDLPFEDDEDMF
ncbi:MAG: hypothetical protein Q4D87_01585 [Actinomycetaceae bacterium]|nr:hypothetical protein [Actinomycetaceae bacterium]